LTTLVFVIALSIASFAQSREYVTVAPEGSLFSIAYGTNARGDIVGTFVDEQFRQHGFLLRKGAYTVIDFPEAAGTDVRGINPRGEIVGNYWYENDPAVALRGFRRSSKGVMESLHYPDHSWEILQGILPDGTVVGCRHDTDTMSTMRGITIGHGVFSEIEAFGSMNNGATPDGNLTVGLWFNMMANRQEAFTIENGVFSSFIVPGSNLTAAWDVNPDGLIVGVFRVGTTVRGFARSGDNYETISYPGAAATRAFGVNPQGDIVGSYVLAGRTYGFLAKAVDEDSFNTKLLR
jgi:uncharacterized membrane protein